MNTDDYTPDIPQDSTNINSENSSDTSFPLEVTNQEKIESNTSDGQEDNTDIISELTSEPSVKSEKNEKKLPKLSKKKPTKAESSLINDEMTKKASLSPRELMGAFLVFLFALLIIFLHLNSRENWKQEMQQTQAEAQILLDSARQMIAQGELQRAEDSLRIRTFKMNYFDAYDENHFRIYGLFRDKDRSMSVPQVAKKFNISSSNSIKKSEVGEEFWFIVPVKGVHYVKKGETSKTIAQKYYFDPRGASLIESFNYNKVEAGKTVFIPFN